jgi:hypothetical protein
MRVAIADGTATLAPRPGWVPKANTTLTLNGKRFTRGNELDDTTLAACGNLAELLRNNLIRFDPPASLVMPKRSPAPTPAPKVAAAPPPDPIEICRAELRKIISTGRTFSEAVDLVDGGVFARAQRRFVDLPRMVADAGFGTSGQKVRTGLGTSRRSVAGLEAYLKEGM